MIILKVKNEVDSELATYTYSNYAEYVQAMEDIYNYLQGGDRIEVLSDEEDD